MHLIGRRIQVTANPPDGAAFSLLRIDDWDFNWQSFYQYATPVLLPAGTRIVMEAVHDNSAANVRNPNQPPRQVRWGEQTVDEMSLVMLQLVPAEELGLLTLVQEHGRRIIGAIDASGAAAVVSPTASTADIGRYASQALGKFDRDADGKLTVDELAAASGRDKESVAKYASPFDADGDGALDLAELTAALKALGKK
jgi:hypothetical protein